MASRIYTKAGDKGKTTLLGGTRVSKGSLRLAAYGAVDTLNAYIGWVADLQTEEPVVHLLRDIQDRLFTIGAQMAKEPEKKIRTTLPELSKKDIDALERAIDKINEAVLPLRSFILPGGHISVSACHIARCHCREAERKCVVLEDAGEEIPELVIPYLNRLGDYLFMLARYAAVQLGVKEIPWVPGK